MSCINNPRAQGSINASPLCPDTILSQHISTTLKLIAQLKKSRDLLDCRSLTWKHIAIRNGYYRNGVHKKETWVEKGRQVPAQYEFWIDVQCEKIQQFERKPINCWLEKVAKLVLEKWNWCHMSWFELNKMDMIYPMHGTFCSCKWWI